MKGCHARLHSLKLWKLCAADFIHGRSANTARESAVKVGSGKNNPLPYRGIEPASVLRLGVDSWVYQLNKLKALVYEIFPPTTTIVDYAIGLEKLSLNEQFFNDAKTAVSL